MSARRLVDLPGRPFPPAHLVSLARRVARGDGKPLNQAINSRSLTACKAVYAGSIPAGAFSKARYAGFVTWFESRPPEGSAIRPPWGRRTATMRDCRARGEIS